MKVRLSAATRAALEQRAASSHVAVSTFIRALILDALELASNGAPERPDGR